MIWGGRPAVFFPEMRVPFPGFVEGTCNTASNAFRSAGPRSEVPRDDPRKGFAIDALRWRSQTEKHFAFVFHSGTPRDRTVLGQAVHQFHGAVMAKL